MKIDTLKYDLIILTRKETKIIFMNNRQDRICVTLSALIMKQTQMYTHRTAIITK